MIAILFTKVMCVSFLSHFLRLPVSHSTSQLCLLTALTHGRFASSLCLSDLSVCLYVCLSSLSVSVSSHIDTNCSRDQEPLSCRSRTTGALCQLQFQPCVLSEVCPSMCPTTLRKMPRLNEPGPLGMRAEHWYDFGSLAGNSDLFVQVIAHIAAAAVPSSVLQYLKAGQITPLAKPTGGHRPLLMMSFLRRLALKSVMAAKKESVAKCAGPFAIRCWKTGWCKHDDQDHPVPCGSRQLSSPCCS